MHSITKQHAQDLLNSFSGDYREIFFERSASTRLRLLNGNIEPLIYSENEGFSVLSRTWDRQIFGAYGSLNEFDSRVKCFASSNNLASTEREMCVLSGESELVFDQRELSVDLLPYAERMSGLPDIAARYGFVTSYEARIQLVSKSYIVANSRGNFGADAQYYNTFRVILTGRKWDIHEEIFEHITGVDVLSWIDRSVIEETFERAIIKLSQVLDGTPAPSGLMDIVIGSEAGGTIIHEAVGHGLEADLQNSSVYKGKIGQKVAHESVNIIDDPTRPWLRGHYLYDHEWNPARKTYLIRDGILESYLHHNKSADLFDAESTGHGRRENYAYTTLVRMGSTYLDAGYERREDLIARVRDGIYVAQMGGGQVNTITGDFAFKVIYGYRICDGKLAEVIRGANISGNGPNMLTDIQGIADDLGYFDGGTCGKGQSMPVSDATPTILVRLKVTGC